MNEKNFISEKEQCLKLANCFEFMPLSDGDSSQSEISSLYLKNEFKDSITFYGGTFLPFHEGHRACLDLCPEKNILIVPDRNPFKNNERPHPFRFFSELAESLRNTPYSLYPGFLALERPNPTASWLPLVKIVEKNFLMGDDSFMGLLKWQNPELIINNLTKLYVVPRIYGKKDYDKEQRLILKINPKIQIIYLQNHNFQHISSTAIRIQK